MTDSLDDLLGPAGSDANGGGGKLRKLLEDTLAQKKALETQLAEVQQQTRATALDGLFTKHGVPALARDLFPQDADPTDEAVTALVEKYGSLWGAEAAAATTPPAEQQAATQMQQFAQVANPTAPRPQSEEEYRAAFSHAQTKDDFLKMLGDFESHITVEG